MKRSFKYLIWILWFCYLIISSILLFTKGFLLTRNIQNNSSTCSDISYELQPKNYNIEGSFISINEPDANKCAPPLSKVILIIIDALRHDFTKYDENNKTPLPFDNKLPIIKHTMFMYPNSTRHYKFIADPPTTTMQRLKALTTGSLPTFIDAGSNFASSEINEDNLIDQLKKNNYSAVFLGDDTWTSLYPNRFLRSYPYPSFNVWDLDTVDNGVMSNIFEELDKKDWNLLVAHFLGVDHCGHRYGPNHPEMARKLTEMNTVIENVIQAMDDESILFVIGDHGMSATGDHGGETLDETTSAIFVHSKRPLMSLNNTTGSVKQVDIVPTLSALLGIPIPFQNLGLIIPDCLPFIEKINFHSLLWRNVQQVLLYIDTYSKGSRIFEQSDLESSREKYRFLKDQLHDTEFVDEAKDFIVHLRALCEKVWIQFDFIAITIGLVSISSSILLILFICNEEIILENSLVYILFPLVALFWSLSILFEVTENLVISFTNVSFVLILALNLKRFKVEYLQFESVLAQFVLILNFGVSFSNSFINEEANVLLYLLTSVIFLNILVLSSKQPIKNDFWKKVLSFLFCLMLLRSSVYYWRCRAEQEWCDLSSNSGKVETSKTQLCVSFFNLFLWVSLVKAWLEKCGNLTGFSLIQILNKTIPHVLVVLVSGYWVLDTYGKTYNYLALSIYSLTIISLVTLLIKPLTITLILNDTDVADPRKKLYQMLKENSTQMEENVPVVCGLGTCYSAVFLIVGSYTVLLMGLVLGGTFASSGVIMMGTVVFYLGVTSILRIKRSRTIDDLFQVPNLTLLGWILLPQYFFYAFGHQPTFSNIAWEAAFVGTRGFFNHRYFMGFLVLFNTFGSYFLTGILLPLLLIAPFTLILMVPSLAEKGSLKEFVGKGEITLYENEDAVLKSLVSVICKCVVGQAVKVLGSMLAATLHCRHLMVWNVFAPKFIFEAVALFVTMFSVILGYLLFVRVSFKIRSLFVSLNKTR